MSGERDLQRGPPAGIFMQRRREPELMDEPDVDPREHRAALAALRRSNRLLGVDARLVDVVAALTPTRGARLLELGSGGGGLSAALSARFCQTHRELGLIALDRSPFAISDARNHIGTEQTTDFVIGNALELPFADGTVDIVICSLLLHHFDPDQATLLLQEATRVASHAVVVCDLDRSALSWMLTWFFTRMTSRSRLFHVDGPRSVRAAYRPAEALRLAARAGMAQVTVRRVFPFRWTMVWRRSVS
jgi:ubiquinone/menaquinone biosynthesis C-methylase UbiE